MIAGGGQHSLGWPGSPTEEEMFDLRSKHLATQRSSGKAFQTKETAGTRAFSWLIHGIKNKGRPACRGRMSDSRQGQGVASGGMWLGLCEMGSDSGHGWNFGGDGEEFGVLYVEGNHGWV